MEIAIAIENQINKHVILEDKSQYSYTVKPVEITNPLGAVIAILDEYSINNNNTENYKLYKTKEGNWYDVPGRIPVENSAILRALKSAIDICEKLSR